MDLRPFLPDTFLQVLHVRSGKKIHGFRGILLLWVSGNVRASNWTLGLSATSDLKFACK